MIFRGRAAREYLDADFFTISRHIQETYAHNCADTKTRRQAFRAAVKEASLRFNICEQALLDAISPPVRMRGADADRFLAVNFMDVFIIATSTHRSEGFDAAVGRIADQFHMSMRAARAWWLEFHDLPMTIAEMHAPRARNRALNR